MQRAWVASRGGRAVVEGRDIGSVVFPDAKVKVFLTARPEVLTSATAPSVMPAREDTKEAVGDRCAVAVRLAVDELLGADVAHDDDPGRPTFSSMRGADIGLGRFSLRLRR